VSNSLTEPLDVVFTVTNRMSIMFVAPIATELHRRGLRLGLITNLGGQSPPVTIAPSLVWHADLPMRRAPSPIHDLAALTRMTRILRRVRPTVVHASTPKAGLLGVVAGRIAGAPAVVFQVRGLRSEGATGLSGRIQRWSEQVSFRLAHGVTLDSPSLIRTAVASGLRLPDNAQVISLGSSIGVNCERFGAITRPTRLDGQERVSIGFIGRIHGDKGVADLIEVWDALSSTRPDLRMVVVGSADPTDPGSLALEAALATRPGIELTGQVDDVTPWLERMDVLVFPSYREGLPNAPLEAQASGIPVVGYAATGTVDAVEHGTGGLLVPVGDRNALTGAVATVIDDAILRAELGAAGQKFVQQHFDQNVVVTAHADFIENLVQSAR